MEYKEKRGTKDRAAVVNIKRGTRRQSSSSEYKEKRGTGRQSSSREYKEKGRTREHSSSREYREERNKKTE